MYASANLGEECRITSDVKARLEGAILTGTAVQTAPKDKDHPTKYAFTAKRIEPVQHREPQHHEFTPTVFYRQFSPHNKPVLTISPGDTVHTTTVDAGGTDEKGVGRVLGGNPETGPFYIEGGHTRRHSGGTYSEAPAKS